MTCLNAKWHLQLNQFNLKLVTTRQFKKNGVGELMDDMIIRDKVSADDDFIFDSFLNNYQATSYFAKRIPKQVFMKRHSAILNLIFARPNTVTKIAGDSSYTIFGYIIAEDVTTDAVIHYIYVRPEYQRLGIATTLITELGIKDKFEVSHWTPVMNEISSKHKGITYVPYRM